MHDTFLKKEERLFLKKLKSVDEMERGELARNILKGIALGVGIASIFVAPGIAVGYKWVDDLSRNNKNRLKRNIKGLIERGYVLEIEKDKYVLTSKGVLKKYENDIKELRINRPERWDGVWRIITFDIPEEKKIARVSLNKKLKLLGFLSLQKSVFVYPHPCRDEFEQIGNFFGVEKNIVFIESSCVSCEDALVRKFKKNKII